ncbi:beta-galactosidase trimerization domain-containing protein [Tissierellaceae bacterium HCP3S3_D8]
MNNIRKKQVHLDFHTSEHIPNVGIDFDKDEFADTLKEASVDSITCFARCHHGWLYYPSKIHPEMIHPNLKNRNLLLDQIDACHKRGIQVPIYTTVQWDGYIGRHHPEWLSVDEEGNYINSQGVEEPHFYYTLCLNTGYRNYFKENLLDIIEVVKPENVDGIFMDILMVTDCCCDNCKKEMEKLSIDISNRKERLRYSKIMLEQFKFEISKIIREKVPGASIFYNGSHVGYNDKKSLPAYTHLELESLPSGGWGYDHFPMTMRYSRNLHREIIGMTGKFHTYWGDFHSLKNEEALQFECFNMLALGAGCSIGDQLHPNGKLSKASYDLIGKVYNKISSIEDKVFNSNIPRVEIGVLTPEETWDPAGDEPRTSPSLLGVNRLLQELNYQFDIIDSEMDFSKYKIIIMPDIIEYREELDSRLKSFLNNGGKVIGSYKSLQKEPNYISNIYGTKYLGESDYDRDFVLPNNILGKTLPKEEFVMYLKGSKIESAGSEVLVDSIKTYFNRENGKFCSHQHAPSSGEKGYPAVVKNKGAIYFSYPIFRIYRKNAPKWIKELLKDSLEMLLDKKILVHNGPSTLLTTINESKDKKSQVMHALHYITQKKSEDIYIIDEIIPLYNTEFKIHIGNNKVRSLKLIPENKDIEYKMVDEYIVFNIDEIQGHAVVYCQLT